MVQGYKLRMSKSRAPDLWTQGSKVNFTSQKCSIYVVASQSKYYLYIFLTRALYLPHLSGDAASRSDFFSKSYIITAEDFEGNEILKQGDITLKR